MGTVNAMVWCGNAMGIPPHERLKLRRQMAAAAGKNASSSLSLCLEVKDIRSGDGALFFMVALSWVEGVWLNC